MKRIIVIICLVFTISLTCEGEFLTKEFMSKYATQMQLHSQRKLMSITLKLGQTERKLKAIGNAKEKGEIIPQEYITATMAEYLNLSNEKEKCKDDVNFWEEIINRNKETTGNQEIHNHTDNVAHNENNYKDYGNGNWRKTIVNEDGSTTTIYHNVCAMCFGNKVCSTCHGTGYQMFDPLVSCGCFGGVCYMCRGLGYTEFYYTRYGSGQYSTTFVNSTTGYSNVLTTEISPETITHKRTMEKAKRKAEETGRYGYITCIHCSGSGVCNSCGGDGIVAGWSSPDYTCSQCNANGKCHYCDGTGKVWGIKDASKLY